MLVSHAHYFPFQAAYLFKYDSTHGIYKGTVDYEESTVRTPLEGASLGLDVPLPTLLSIRPRAHPTHLTSHAAIGSPL